MNVDRASVPALLFALIIGAGFAAGGLLAGNGFARARAADRYVTVKGVSEREVRADLAIWPIHLAGARQRCRDRECQTRQFAHDSHSDLGGIRQANQGVFEILPRDEAPHETEASQIAKVVRVVATIDYYLR